MISPLLPLCFFLINFSSTFTLTSGYTLPDQYFINCGSGSSAVVYGKNFTGDVNPVRFSLSHSNSIHVEDPNSSSVGFYQSARIFRKPSWYEFDIEQNGTFVVRFHFLRLSSFDNVSDARFSVVASGFSLLSLFMVEKMDLSPRTEEFLMPIPVGKFKVSFVPDGDNSFAFVNAIEVFIAPPDFIPNSITLVTRQGNNGLFSFQNLLSFALRVIYRVNVGGEIITPDDDTLLRIWIPDDPFLFNRDAMNHTIASVRKGPRYNSYGATKFHAPEFVYSSARRSDQLYNITWHFNVTKGTKHLLRVHFCDIDSTSNEALQFLLYINSQFDYMIQPYDPLQPKAPFYKDYQVDSDHLGSINVSVCPESGLNYPRMFALLNGVEIMQLIESTGSDKWTSLFVIIGSVVGSSVIVIVILMLVILYLKRRKSKVVEAFDQPSVLLYGGSSYGRTTDKSVEGSSFVELNLGLKLHLSEILYATRNFDTKLMIGAGGFGKVYKGTLRDGTEVAVKRSEPGSGQGLPEFQTEITVLSKIRHNHLVSFIGYCDERDEMILVYEFMEKGTLRDHLYKMDSTEKSTSSSMLSWDQRLRICVGAAKGIHYLHTGLSGVIIHRDIKSTNILLDENYVAKVADFGLSRSSLLEETHVSTDHVKGSFGYFDPEYFGCLQLTQKSDVYSFGVVLLEVLCARPVIDQSLGRDEVSLAEWGMSWIKKGQLEEIVDPLLKGKINPDSLRKFGETAGKCLQEHGADRPNMIDVLWDLDYSLKLQQTATRAREPYEDGTTDVGIPTQVIGRLPSLSVPTDEDESCSTSEVNAGEVFTLLKMDGEAR